MRPFAIILFVLSCLAGCPSSVGGAADKGPGDDDDNGSGSGSGSPNRQPCIVDDDCAPAAATCCECPTFAVATDDPVYQACQGIECPMRECPANVGARCSVDYQCELACEVTECPATDCADGYAIDAATGCVSCACAAPAGPGASCRSNTECVATRADCCGCENGGAETAVPASEQAAYDQMLGCDAYPQCPGVNTCAMDAEPSCVQGSCKLVDGGLPDKACGRADLPACPTGEVCVVNANDQANMYGVGICRTP